MTNTEESTVPGLSEGSVRPEPRRLSDGWSPALDVQYLAVAGEVHKVPGSTTRDGQQGIATAVRNSLDKVRKNVRNRTDNDDNRD